MKLYWASTHIHQLLLVTWHIWLQHQSTIKCDSLCMKLCNELCIEGYGFIPLSRSWHGSFGNCAMTLCIQIGLTMLIILVIWMDRDVWIFSSKELVLQTHYRGRLRSDPSLGIAMQNIYGIHSQRALSFVYPLFFFLIQRICILLFSILYQWNKHIVLVK